MLGKPMTEWVSEYAAGHQHAINRLMHTWGIPMIAISIPMFGLCFVEPQIFWLAATLFIIGGYYSLSATGLKERHPSFLRTGAFCLSGYVGGLRKSKVVHR